MLPRPIQPSPQGIHLPLELVLRRSRVLKFLCGYLLVFIRLGARNRVCQIIERVAPNTFLLDLLRHAAFEDLGDAAHVVPNLLGLAHQHPQDLVLGTVVVEEVSAEHLVRRLQLAVDPAVSLVQAARVPR